MNITFIYFSAMIFKLNFFFFFAKNIAMNLEFRLKSID